MNVIPVEIHLLQIPLEKIRLGPSPNVHTVLGYKHNNRLFPHVFRKLCYPGSQSESEKIVSGCSQR